MLYSGSLNVYFPCKLKETSRFRSRLKMIKRVMARQYQYAVRTDAPLTDLMDLKDFREEKEAILDFMGNSLKLPMNEYSPYALPCLQDEYRTSREDGQFAKNTNTVLSRFKLEYDELTSGENGVEINGVLLYNINWDNAVGTTIVVLNFKNLQSDDLILLKHLFYKRAKVKIIEYSKVSVGKCDNCQGGCKFKCLDYSPADIDKYNDITFQEYVMMKNPICKNDLEYPVGTRARYSLMEIEEPDITHYNELEIYGLLYADEGWWHTKGDKTKLTPIRYKDYYQLYVAGCNGLVVTQKEKVRKFVDDKNRFFASLQPQLGHVKYVKQKYAYCIAGLQKKCFPNFLKTVELHYLTNVVATSEITEKQHSYFNPFIFVKRGYQLWKIIYELDINLYYHNKEMQEAFGVKKYMQDIKEEYNLILQHGVNFLVAILTVLTLLTSIP